jgi:hypothetical protein
VPNAIATEATKRAVKSAAAPRVRADVMPRSASRKIGVPAKIELICVRR